SLLVAEAYVDEGPTLKRFRPRAQGRAYRIRKRTCHITVVVESVAVAQTRAAKATVAKATKATKAASAGERSEPADDDGRTPAKKAAAKKATANKAAAKKAPAAKADAEEETE